MSSKYTPRPAIVEGDIAKLPLGIDAKDGYALIDAQFADLSRYKWRLHKSYAIGWVGKRGVLLHRHITKAARDLSVDHINHDPLDNRLSNLRLCTHAENMRNIDKKAKATSGYKGVSFYKRDGTFSAYITKNYKKIHIGYFQTAKEAAQAYDHKARELFGEFANLNFKEI